MDTKTVNRMFKAVADENRLRILHLLTKGELCVCDLIDALKMRQSRVSRHLAYLRNSGLVKSRRDGLWIYYSLASSTSKFHSQLLACLDGCLNDVPALQADRKSLSKVTREC